MPANLSDPRLQTALNRVNFYRQQAGVRPASLHPALVASAQGHADYFRQNFPLPGNPHVQTPGKPGFTGETFFMRCKAAGYPSESVNENIAYVAEPGAAVDAFMPMLNHRIVIIDPRYPDVGFGFAATPDGKGVITVIDFGIPVFKEVFEPAWVLYPPEGGVNFGRQCRLDSPDAFGASHPQYPLGNPISIQYRGPGAVEYDPGLFSLTDANGTPLPVYSSVKPPTYAFERGATFAAQKPLQPNITYTASFGYRLNGGNTQVRRWRFSTGPTLDNGGSLYEGAGLAGADENVRNLWFAADGPLAGGKVTRSWLYGPKAFDIRQEPYIESPGGQRAVFYFDKARMEINDPAGDRASQWFVSTGLLVYELISGQMQLGNTRFEPRQAAVVQVAGDPLSVNLDAPTYASFGAVASLNNDRRMPNRVGQAVTETIDKNGQVGTLPDPPGPVKYSSYDNILGHNIPDVIVNWSDSLPNPLTYLVGLPLTEAYWAKVRLGGQEQLVLIQVFQRRTVTYTPSNAPGWQVEMGNVGQHYHVWRYG